MFLKDTSVQVLFLVPWRIDGELLSCFRQLLIAYFRFCLLLKSIYPAIAHPIRELLFLAPGNALWQVIFKGFPKNPFFDTPLTDHLVFRINAHSNVYKLLIQKRNPSFYSPGSK